jgi:hypothetical protein
MVYQQESNAKPSAYLALGERINHHAANEIGGGVESLKQCLKRAPQSFYLHRRTIPKNL